MKKLMDKLLTNIKFDKRYVFFSLILVIIGIITGSIFVVIIDGADKSLVIEYMESFFNNIKSGNINFIDSLKNTLFINYLTIIIMSILGFTYFFTSVNILILFYKSFIIGFSLSSFILTYKLKGILLSIIYIFPHLLLNILLFALLTAFTLKLSIHMIKYIIKKKEVNMRLYFNKYVYIIILIIILITMTGLYESFISPYILKFILNILI